MKKIILITMILIASTCRAGIVWPDLQPDSNSDNNISYVSGYLTASLYDVYVSEHHIDIHKTRKSMELAGLIPIPMGEEWSYLGWKLGLGAAAGLAMGLHAADRDNRQLGLSEVAFGALGGLTCITLHF